MAGGKILATVLPSAGSDHWPVSLEWKMNSEHLRRPFRFEKFWLLQPKFPKKLHSQWQELDLGKGTVMYQFQQKLKMLKGKIKSWNKTTFGNIFLEKKKLDHQLQEVQVAILHHGCSEELQTREALPLKELCLKERQVEVFWEHKSHNQWLRNGDCNTSFFHKATIQHRQGNRIAQI